MYNMYIIINIKSTTGILTAINVTDIHMQVSVTFVLTMVEGPEPSMLMYRAT